ncbi:cytochrome-c peroxidase [Luteolibacter luteus]|uniref:cytochrome-c peroxidase n=1 Tax=Luteolibacter luteus TaxID=2728835 RepID=UPI001F0FE3DE|nr:cytochrome c peroxidase [Luteolibacter luteus]
MTIEVHDAGNHSWRLQSATDLNKWTNEGSYRVYNGLLRIAVPADGSGRFYRLDSDQAGSVLSSSNQALALPASPFNYANPVLPAHLLNPLIQGQDNTPASNPTTNAGAALGRVLFHDKRLSANQTISCSSCHQAAHGFSDPRRFSVGFEGGLTGRNSMGLTNARYYLRGNFFWDERAATLEDQVLIPIQNEVEMGMTLELLVTRISAEPFYAELFTSAFGRPTVTSQRISRALAQFVRSIASGNSKYDQGVPVNFSNFTVQENQGRQIFQNQGNCVACHGSDNFVPGNNIFNNGLENPYIDKGVGEITGLSADEGLFKVPSLRNVALTAPYMHDGRFATLEEVVEFYNSGVVNHPNLSPPLRLPPGPPGSPPLGPRRLNLTDSQKAALVAFLRTLTDISVTTDPKFSDPFRYTAP